MVTFSSTGSAVSGTGSAAGSAASTDNAQAGVAAMRQVVDASTEKKQEKKISSS